MPAHRSSEGGAGGNLRVVAAAVAGAGLGGTLAYWLAARARSEKEAGTSEGRHPVLRLGAPAHATTIVSKPSFVSMVDNRTRVPAWVAERILPKSAKRPEDAPPSRDNVSFFEEAEVPAHLRASLDAYSGSGYDRGHMAPASNHKSSEEALRETFSLANIAPQVGKGMNRHYWARVERFVTLLGRAAPKAAETFVVTGPLYLPEPIRRKEDSAAKPPPNPPRWEMRYPLLGRAPSLVAVPTHFFKVVAVVPAAQDAALVGAFVVPNAPIPPDVPIEDFAVPLRALEAAAGFSFFDSFLNGPRRRALESAEQRWFATRTAEQTTANKRKLLGAPPQLVIPDVPTTRGTPADAKAQPRVGRIAHLCEATKCELPKVDFWKDFKKDPPPKRTQTAPGMLEDLEK